MRTPKVVNDFEAAVRAHEFKGAMPPEDWEQIDEDFVEAKQKLCEALRKREKKDAVRA